MKKLLGLLLSISITFFTFAQAPSFPNQNLNNSNASTIFGYLGGLTSNGYKPKQFSDTTAANAAAYLKFTPYIVIAVGDNLYMRNGAITQWILVGGVNISTGIVNYIDSSLNVINQILGLTSTTTRLLTGSVYKDTLMDFIVTDLTYLILGKYYTSTATTFTFNPADEFLDRYSIVVVDTLGNIIIRDGAAAIPAQIPLPTQYELLLGTYFIPASATSTNPISTDTTGYFDGAHLSVTGDSIIHTNHDNVVNIVKLRPKYLEAGTNITITEDGLDTLIVSSTGGGATLDDTMYFFRYVLYDSVMVFKNTSGDSVTVVIRGSGSGGAASRFGIEDNTGVQDRYMDMGIYDYLITAGNSDYSTNLSEFDIYSGGVSMYNQGSDGNRAARINVSNPFDIPTVRLRSNVGSGSGDQVELLINNDSATIQKNGGTPKTIVTSVEVNGSEYTADNNGKVDLGTVGGSGSGITSLGTPAYGLTRTNDSTYIVDSAVIATRDRLINELALKASVQSVIDSAAALQSRLDLKLDKSDTTNKWVQDVYARGDSVFRFKNGVETFVIKLTSSGSGGDSIVSVLKNAIRDSIIIEMFDGRRFAVKDSIGAGGGSTAKLIWVNVADYADSTGVIDATSGINAAIAATAEGGTLFFPHGIYKTSGGHTVTRQIKMVGAGGSGHLEYVPPGTVYPFRRGATVIFSTSASATVFDLSGEASMVENIDFRLDSTITPTTAIGLKISGGTGDRITNNSFYNFNTGIHYQNGGMWTIKENMFRANRSNGLLIENIRIPEEGDQVLTGNWFYGTDAFAVPGQVGVRQHSSGGLKAYGNKFNNGLATCIFLKNAGNASISVIDISHNSFEGYSGYAIRVDSSVYSATNMMFTYNEMYAKDTLPGAGIALLAPTTNVSIYGNLFATDKISTIKAALILGATTATASIGFNSYTNYVFKMQDLGATFNLPMTKSFVLNQGNSIATNNDWKFEITSANKLRLSSSIANAAFGRNFDFGTAGEFTVGTGNIIATAGNLNLTAGYIDFGNSFFIGPDASLLGTGSGGSTYRYNANGVVFGSGNFQQYFKPGYSIFSTSAGNPNSSIPLSAIFELESTLKGWLPPRLTTTQSKVIIGGVATGTITNAGSGYTPGTYGPSLTGGTGTGASATIVVNGSGVVSSVTLPIPTYGQGVGIDYTVGDVLTATGMGAGTGFTYTVATLSTAATGLQFYNSTINANQFYNGVKYATAATWGYTAITSTYTALTTDYTINCTSGTFTVTLPTAVGIEGKVYIVKNSGAGTITMAAAGAETFDGSASPTIAAGAVAQWQSTNAGWIKIN